MASYSIAADTNRNVWLTGLTASADFPATPGAFQPQKSLNEDVFLVKLGRTGPIPVDPRLSKKVYLPLAQR